MTQPAADMSLSVRLVTACVLALTAGILMAALFRRSLPLMGMGTFLAAASLACYLLAPARYELSDGKLTVCFRLGRFRYGQVTHCAPLRDVYRSWSLIRSLRLFGNGGLFAATGFFWNRRLGIFRAFVTSARPDDLLLVETDTARKIVISPRDPITFARACAVNS